MLNSLNIDNAEEYLKKFFNLEFQLPANENVAFEELLKLLDRKYQELEIDEKREHCMYHRSVMWSTLGMPSLI